MAQPHNQIDAGAHCMRMLNKNCGNDYSGGSPQTKTFKKKIADGKRKF